MLVHFPRIITDGLVLCLAAANPVSYTPGENIWKDLSGNGNNGTLVNGVGYSGDNLGFDGVNDFQATLSLKQILDNYNALKERYGL
jgi:hypothetical protein